MVNDVLNYSDFLNKFKKASEIIDSRIEECISKGHLQPNVEGNKCLYCFRQIIYYAPKTYALLKKRRELFPIYPSMGTSLMNKLMEEEINYQKRKDKLKGIKELMKTFNL